MIITGAEDAEDKDQQNEKELSEDHRGTGQNEKEPWEDHRDIGQSENEVSEDHPDTGQNDKELSEDQCDTGQQPLEIAYKLQGSRISANSMLGSLKIEHVGTYDKRSAFACHPNGICPLGYIVKRTSRRKDSYGRRYQWKLWIEEKDEEPLFCCIRTGVEMTEVVKHKTPSEAWKQAVRANSEVSMNENAFVSAYDPFGLRSDRLQELLEAKQCEQAEASSNGKAENAQVQLDMKNPGNEADGSQDTLVCKRTRPIEAKAPTASNHNAQDMSFLLWKRISVLSPDGSDPPVIALVTAVLPAGVLTLLFEDGSIERGVIYNYTLLTATTSRSIAFLDNVG